MSRVDTEPTDGFATFMCLLCWFGYLGLGAAHTFRKPGFAFAALVVIVVAYSVAAWKERRGDFDVRLRAITARACRKGEQLRARLAWRKRSRA